MKRFAAVLATGATLSSLGVVGATEATARTTGTAATTTAASTSTCANGFAGVLQNRVCITVDGTTVTAGGYTTPTTTWTAQDASYTLTLGVVGGASLGTDTGSGILPPGGRGFGYLAATAPCGSTVTATLLTTTWGFGATATVTAPVTC
ncbi:hypothetical protein GCM10009639_14810 [Kitasatospora putterlickiae]|uniref:Secreted protein n=1 Tax=Kitasatospora putterlickiae TaxID=221725 RepID=A0ABP4IHJ5_9ACTN